jgi:hypothetical protein
MAETPDDTLTGSENGYILIDLGKKKRKAVRRLRKGRGKLLDQVKETVDELQTSGAVGEAVQIVLVVVRQKQRPRRWF